MSDTKAELKEKLERLSESYSDRFPTKSEYIEGKKDTHNYMPYEVRYEVEDAYLAGAQAAIELMQEREAKLVAALRSLSNESQAFLTFKDEMRSITGNTNIACLENRIVEARSVLTDLGLAPDGGEHGE